MLGCWKVFSRLGDGRRAMPELDVNSDEEIRMRILNREKKTNLSASPNNRFVLCYSFT